MFEERPPFPKCYADDIIAYLKYSLAFYERVDEFYPEHGKQLSAATANILTWFQDYYEDNKEVAT